MASTLILLILTLAFTGFAAFLHGYKKGYGEGKIAGAFRTRAESASR